MRNITVNGKTFAVNNARPNFWDEVESGKWEPDTFKVFDLVLEEGKTFLDIGAWNGVTSMYANAFGCNVIAVEPDAQVLGELLNNFTANHIPHDRVAHVAIGDRNDTIALSTISQFGDSMSSIAPREGTKEMTFVPCLKLETFIEVNGIDIDNVCLIKIDVEGSEVTLLIDAKEYLAKHKPTIHFSTHPFWWNDKSEAITIIKEIIYSIYDVFIVQGESLIPVLRDEFNHQLEIQNYSFLLVAKQ